MKTFTTTWIGVCLVVTTLAPPARAEKATRAEALTVANNWIALIIQLEGDWGGHKEARVAEIAEFKRADRLLGYCCRVAPGGHIVIPLHKELGPVKAYSATSNLDPASDEGLTDIIKGGIEQMEKAVEKKLGPVDGLSAKDLDSILEINGRPAWERLAAAAPVFRERLSSGRASSNYQASDILLSTHWHQEAPYNYQCPDMGCTRTQCSTNNSHALVGCIAVAGAQTMRHWCWPPYGSDGPSDHAFDWANVRSTYRCISGSFVNESGSTCTQAELDAVAKLCHEVGQEVDMNYGCHASSAYFASYPGPDLLDAFEDHFRFHNGTIEDDADNKHRSSYSANGWFNLLKSQINQNRPVPYRFDHTLGGGHAVVADGWKEEGDPLVKMYHINYGWGRLETPPSDGNDTWYSLDAIWGSAGDEEILIGIRPEVALGSSLSGTYARQSFPYRYFDQDTSGQNVTFSAGQRLQLLQNVTVTCTGSPVRFLGSTAADETHLFTRGDLSKGAKITNGSIKLNAGGTLCLR